MRCACDECPCLRERDNDVDNIKTREFIKIMKSLKITNAFSAIDALDDESSAFWSINTLDKIQIGEISGQLELVRTSDLAASQKGDNSMKIQPPGDFPESERFLETSDAPDEDNLHLWKGPGFCADEKIRSPRL